MAAQATSANEAMLGTSGMSWPIARFSKAAESNRRARPCRSCQASAGEERKLPSVTTKEGMTPKAKTAPFASPNARSEHHRRAGARARRYRRAFSSRYGHRARQQNHRADRQVDAAHEHDEGRAEARQQQRARLSENARGVAQRQEGRRRDREKRRTAQRRRRRQPQPDAQRLKPDGPRGCRAWCWPRALNGHARLSCRQNACRRRPEEPSINRMNSTSVGLASGGRPRSPVTRPCRMMAMRFDRPISSSSSSVIRMIADPCAPSAVAGCRRSPPWRRRRRRASDCRAPAARTERHSQRASTTFCWLPPDSLRQRRPGPRAADSSSLDHPRGDFCLASRAARVPRRDANRSPPLAKDMFQVDREVRR